MRQYEMTYLISDKVAETDLNKVTGKVGGFITDMGGRLLKEEIWKRRKLAYPIKKQEFATYVTLNFELSGDKVNAFDRQIRLSPNIIRHLMIVKDYGTEELTLTSDEIVGTEAIEEVAGGERAFEAIEGETEESRDLMAVREKEEEEETTEETEAEEPKNETQEKTETDAKETEKDEEKETPETPVEEPAKEEKKPIRKRTKPVVESEADRLAKLDEEIDSILKDEL